MRAMVKNASVIGVSQFKSIQQNGFSSDLSLGAIKIIDKNNNEGCKDDVETGGKAQQL